LPVAVMALKDEKTKALVTEIEATMQKILAPHDAADASEKKTLLAKLGMQAKKGPAEVQEWVSSWKDTLVEVSRCMGSTLPRFLAKANSDLESELHRCSKRENEIEEAVSSGDWRSLKRHSGAMDTTVFDFTSPKETVKDVAKLQDGANAARKKMQAEVISAEKTVEQQAARVTSLDMSSEAGKLEKAFAAATESIDAASTRMEDCTNKEKMKAPGGRKKILLDAGVKGVDRLDAQGISKELAKLKTKRVAERERAAAEAAKAVLPGAEIQQKVQDVTDAKERLKKLQAEILQQLGDHEKDAAEKKKDAGAVVEVLEGAHAELEKQIRDREVEEVELIEEESLAHGELEDVARLVTKVTEKFEQAKAKRGVARIRIAELRTQEESLSQLIAQVRTAVADADTDFMAWSTEAERVREKLDSSINEKVAAFDSAALQPVQAAYTNCQCSASLLAKAKEDGEVEEQHWQREIASLEEKRNELERKIDAEDCEDMDGLMEDFGRITDELEELREKLAQCQARLQKWRQQTSEAEESAEQLLSLGLAVQAEEAEEKSKKAVLDAYRGKAHFAQRPSTSAAGVAPDALATIAPTSGVSPADLEAIVQKAVEQKLADMMIEEERNPSNKEGYN